MADIKQVVVVRSDFKGIPRGKEGAQIAHASQNALLPHLHTEWAKTWLAADYRKVVLHTKGEDALHALFEQAQAADLPCWLQVDNGRTYFKEEKTVTALAIGPAPADQIDKITGELALR